MYHQTQTRYQRNKRDMDQQTNHESSQCISVMTSGGDCQGMNAAVRAIVRGATRKGITVYAIYEGYFGLVTGGDLIRPITWDTVAGFLQFGGTYLGTSRCMEYQNDVLVRRTAVYNLVSKGINKLICIGGDGSLTGATVLEEEWFGHISALVDNEDIPSEYLELCPKLFLVGLVGSIDNDMCGTHYTIGTDSALHRIMECLDSIATTAFSHQRCFIVEVMGRSCGYLALCAGLAAGADWIFIPEYPPQDGWEQDMIKSIKRRRNQGNRFSLIIIAEGALDCRGDKITSDQIHKLITSSLDIETRISVLGHVQRGGVPSAYDRIISTIQGLDAVETILTEPETPVLLGVEGKLPTKVDLRTCIRQTKEVNVALKGCNFERALELRGVEFQQNLDAYFSSKKRVKIDVEVKEDYYTWGIINVGSPAPGMNTCVRACARNTLDMGNEAVAFSNGFHGLAEGQGEALLWKNVSDWSFRGGSLLGAERALPEEVGFEKIANSLKEWDINGLIIIGGYEGYIGALQLKEQRENFESLNIPIICIPSTVSNNCPGTDYSIGSDTALNKIVEYCDILKQSSVSTKNRVFVMDILGGHCGYLCMMGAIAAGAQIAYIPENPLTLQMLSEDLEYIKNRTEKYGRTTLVLNTDKSSDVYNTSILAKIMNAESTKGYSVREVVLGQTQHGYHPKPLDRIRGELLARMSVDRLQTLCDTNESATEGAGIIDFIPVVTPLEELIAQTDMDIRRPLEQWWLNYYYIISELTTTGGEVEVPSKPKTTDYKDENDLPDFQYRGTFHPL
eukprot:TRINITY_DN4126_c0_g1_i1.p1 TRINITY_DN4126_c0_g1~~TRINITY_DN4126_c0_g1_i1.p1  ORF type:complete len:815 (+),score=145.57 TRINITY_DN4126_c0_g1_i1:75-2447(+)